MTLAALIMSLEPAWFHAIFGVYYFSGAAVGFLAALVLAALVVQGSGRLTGTITAEHYHDLGKLLFGFVVWWGYIAFSQYMLIWYGNIPEETVYYLKRQTGPWAIVSLVLLFGHLLIPFLGMLPHEVERRRVLLGFWAVWLLVFHWLDMYWLVMPNLGGGAGCQPASSGRLAICRDECLPAGRDGRAVPGRRVGSRRGPAAGAAERSAPGRILAFENS